MDWLTDSWISFFRLFWQDILYCYEYSGLQMNQNPV